MTGVPALALRSSITAVGQPTYDIGRQAAELLLRRVRRESCPSQHIVLPTTLTVRESSLRGRPFPAR
jgi:LacI family transcriptional regulator